MRKLGIGVLVLVAAAAGAAAWLLLRSPEMAPASANQVAVTPERVARGKYLYEAVADCEGCHSPRDFTRFSGPVEPGKSGSGFVFPEDLGFPGRVVASNITPDRDTGIGNWTDGEKIRAIRDGVSKDGRALFPLMGYPRFRSMSDQDVEAVVAYLNSLPAVRNALPKTELSFPVSLLIKSVPRPAGSVPPADRSNKLQYGEYLANLAGCVECHTQDEKGRLVEGMYLAGGREFKLSNTMIVRSANISPDPETGIGKWSEQKFLDTFYQYKGYLEKGAPKVGPERFTLMPWLGFARMTPEDLGAIYAYLMSRPPVVNKVEVHPGYARLKSSSCQATVRRKPTSSLKRGA